MAEIAHSALTDPQLHEPKGISTALTGTVYRANGAGSGTWVPTQYVLSGVLADVSTASTLYFPTPFQGTVVRVTVTLGGSIAANDDTITVRNAAGISMGAITVPHSGSAAGNTFTLNPVSNNTISSTSFLTVETNGASSSPAPLYISVVIDRTN
jgi:hypothetical protein